MAVPLLDTIKTSSADALLARRDPQNTRPEPAKPTTIPQPKAIKLRT
jgi:hypothetical protein